MTLLHFWQMSLSGGILILVIAAVRALAVNRLPKRTFSALWGLALLRLTVPISLPARVSVYTLATRLVPEASAQISAGTQMGTVPAQTALPLPSTPVADIAAPLPGTASHAASSPWTLVWLLGAGLCMALLALAYGKCRREFRTSLPVDNASVQRWLETHPLRRRVQVRQSELVSAPLTYGIFRPVILLPKPMDQEDTSVLSYVLEHEYVHIRRLDALTKPLFLAVLCLHWFNPAVWLMALLANRDLELSCDEAVLRRHGLDARQEYAKALLSLEARRSGLTPFYSSFSKNAMEERMNAMLKMKKSTRFAAAIACVLVLVIAAGFCTSALSAEASTDGQPEIYENTELGFRMQLPADWAGQYVVEPHPTAENAVIFYTKATEEPGWRTEDLWGGALCYLFKTPMEEWIAGGRGADAPTAFRVLGENDAYVYRMVFPGDVNYDPENPAQTQKYEAMWDTLFSGDLAFEILDSPRQLAGYLKEADNGTLVVVVTEYITAEDTERMAELGLTEDDLPDGYYFHTEDSTPITLQYDGNTQFTFIDWYNDFTVPGSDRNYTTRDFSQFRQYLDTYTDGQPKMPFFFTVQGDVVQLVLEKPFM